jgi:DNA-binding YbaB/EbfC family protein
MTDFDINALMQQAQALQQQVQDMQAKLADETVEGSAGGGMVKVTATGAQRITKIEIDEAALGEDKEMLQDLIIAAVNQALEKTKELAGQKMGSMLPPGMMPPGGLGGMFGG